MMMVSPQPAVAAGTIRFIDTAFTDRVRLQRTRTRLGSGVRRPWGTPVAIRAALRSARPRQCRVTPFRATQLLGHREITTLTIRRRSERHLPAASKEIRGVVRKSTLTAM